MPRAITSNALHAAAPGAPLDTYNDRVVKYIPGDIVAAWLAANGIIKGVDPRPGKTTLWVVFAIALLICGAWTYKQVARTNSNAALKQMLVSSGAFVVWVYALGGPFPDWVGIYRAWIGSLLVIAYTFVAGIVIPDK